jgi:hypothetical protein
MPKRGQLKSSASSRSKRQRAFNSKPEQKKRRAARNKVRRQANKSGRTKKGDGKDIDHLNRKTLSPGSTRVVSKSVNRAKNSPLKRRRRR